MTDDRISKLMCLDFIFTPLEEKKIICIETNEILSCQEAKKKYGHIRINNACNNENRASGTLEDGTRLHWLYYNDYLNMTLEERDKYKNSVSNKVYYRTSIKVICLNTNKLFTNIDEAMNWCNIKKKSSIVTYFNKKSKSLGRHPKTGEALQWMYYDEYCELTEKEKKINLN